MKLINARDIKQNATLNMLIYGAPGVGKTTFSATAPKPLILNLEGGEKSIMDKDVDLAQCDTIADVKEAFQHAMDNAYKTIVFDSLTRYSEILMEAILVEDRKEKPQIQHWGTLINRIKKMVWALQKMEINTIFICHEKEDKDEDTAIKRPSLNGGLPQAISGIMDIVGYLYVLPTGERRLSVNPSHKWYAKHRTPGSNKITEDLAPDFQVLMDRVFEPVPKKTDPKKVVKNNATNV